MEYDWNMYDRVGLNQYEILNLIFDKYIIKSKNTIWGWHDIFLCLFSKESIHFKEMNSIAREFFNV
jgi:hypothetical protein